MLRSHELHGCGESLHIPISHAIPSVRRTPTREVGDSSLPLQPPKCTPQTCGIEQTRKHSETWLQRNTSPPRGLKDILSTTGARAGGGSGSAQGSLLPRQERPHRRGAASHPGIRCGRRGGVGRLPDRRIQGHWRLRGGFEVIVRW